MMCDNAEELAKLAVLKRCESDRWKRMIARAEAEVNVLSRHDRRRLAKLERRNNAMNKEKTHDCRKSQVQGRADRAIQRME